MDRGVRMFSIKSRSADRFQVNLLNRSASHEKRSVRAASTAPAIVTMPNFARRLHNVVYAERVLPKRLPVNGDSR